MSTPLLAAVLIVKDEAGTLPGCLKSLAGVVNEIHVHDTGSGDGTAEVAERFGASVTRGTWDGDFGAARNQAAAGCSAMWVLALDADHRVATADPGALRGFLAEATTDAVRVDVADEHHANPYRHLETRLYRPAAVRWSGRVHERLVRAGGSVADRGSVPGAVLSLRHLGQATAEGCRRRAERNLALGGRMLDELISQGPQADRERIAGTLLAMGRDSVAAERWQQGVDTFEVVRDLFPGTPEWMQATDGLARLVLATAYDKLCLVLVDQMRDAGADAGYCNWLAAQALAQLGDPHQAAALLSDLTEIVDTAGRRRDPETLRELSTMIDRLRVLAPL
ncbi:MAG TPA: glycosyltransferase [Actinoplanes sp.]|jgi:hypothetical protein